MTRKEDVIVLSYYDCIIRMSDLLILRSNGWLNDAIISFYFAYLEQERFDSNENILFIGPEVTQCLKESPSNDVPVFLDPLNAKQKDFIFFAVNDSGKSSGGSHWSLLLFIRPDNKFYHIDSSSQTNYLSAIKLAQNLGHYVHNPEFDVLPDFIEMNSLQQDNSYDCGIYLICNVENIAEHLLSNGSLIDVPFVKRETVATMRQDILKLIAECKSHTD